MATGTVTQNPGNLIAPYDGGFQPESVAREVPIAHTAKAARPDVWIDDPGWQPPKDCCLRDRRGDGFVGENIGKLLDLLMRLIDLLFRGDNGGGNKALDSGQATGPGESGKLENVGGRQAVKLDGPEGFLWKPESDSDGKLAVLLPKQMTDNVSEVVLKGPDGKVLEKGRLTGVGNGDREHFRFPKPGGSYPVGMTVEVRMKDGSIKAYEVPNPNLRHD